jgi:hypothetical protein
MHSSILRRIWLNFMAQDLVFFGSYTLFTIFFSDSNFYGLSTNEENKVAEMCIWYIKIGIVLVLL